MEDVTGPGAADGSGSGTRPARHDLVLVAPEHWPAVVRSRRGPPSLSAAQAAAVDGWAGEGRPVVARRPSPGDPPDALPVGLPLPPSLGKARLALAIPPGVPWRPAAGVTLAQARPHAPRAWRGTLDAVLVLARPLGLEPRVFGALLWQAATGLDYLHPGSDLDLLWPVADPSALGPLLDGLVRIEAASPVRLDGELLCAAGGVNWRELAEARGRPGQAVLVKSLDRAGFAAADDVMAGRPRREGA